MSKLPINDERSATAVLSAEDEFERRYGKFGGVETRVVPILVRAADNGDPESEFSIDGHAAVFDKESLNLGYFTEFIAPSAFDRVLGESPDVVANWDHNNLFVLGRTTNNTLKLKTDASGLAYWVRVAQTSYASDLRVLLERGDINQASFSFTVANDEWVFTTVDGEEHVTRTILEVEQLFDVCVTAQGAYPQTNSQISRAYVHDEAERRIAAKLPAVIPVDQVEEPVTTEQSSAVRLTQARVRARSYKLRN